MTEELSEERQPQNGGMNAGEESQNESEQDLEQRDVGAKKEDPSDNDQDTETEDPDEGYDDTDYCPDFIHEWLQNPPILPGENGGAFEQLFESFELNYKQRPKTDLEYLLTIQATIATWELMRYERMKVAIVTNERRSAVESLHRRCSADPSTQDKCNEIRKSAHDGGRTYFADPGYRKKFRVKLEDAGFGPNAVEGTAFLRALPSLTTIDRLIKSAEKRLADCLKKLDAAYATRDPEQPMPRSMAARRMDDLQQQRIEKMKANNGLREADSGE
jgi:hypothetical protein